MERDWLVASLSFLLAAMRDFITPLSLLLVAKDYLTAFLSFLLAMMMCDFITSLSFLLDWFGVGCESGGFRKS